MTTYSYAVEGGQASKYFTSEKLLGREGEIVTFDGTKFFIVVIDGNHVQCLNNQ